MVQDVLKQQKLHKNKQKTNKQTKKTTKKQKTKQNKTKQKKPKTKTKTGMIPQLLVLYISSGLTTLVVRPEPSTVSQVYK